jgi:hypothetical protein
MTDPFPDMRNAEKLDDFLAELGITIEDTPTGNQTGPEELRTGQTLTHTETGLTKYISPLFGFVSKEDRKKRNALLWGVASLLHDVRKHSKRRAGGLR